jgi:hypothetical protein
MPVRITGYENQNIERSDLGGRSIVRDCRHLLCFRERMGRIVDDRFPGHVPFGLLFLETASHMSDRKKPGVAFWATVALVVVLAYPASYGPAEWIFARGLLPRSISPALGWIYFPMLRLRVDGPKAVREAINWYYGAGMPG